MRGSDAGNTILDRQRVTHPVMSTPDSFRIETSYDSPSAEQWSSLDGSRLRIGHRQLSLQSKN